MTAQQKHILQKTVEAYKQFSDQEKSEKVKELERNISFREKAWFEFSDDYYFTGKIFLRYIKLWN